MPVKRVPKVTKSWKGIPCRYAIKIDRDNITGKPQGRHGISNHRQLNCLFNSLLRVATKKIVKLRETGPFMEGPVAGRLVKEQ